MKHSSTIPSTDRRQGATAVEFALVFPVFMTVILFFFEAWRFTHFQQAVDQATLDVARAAIVPGATVAQAKAVGTSLLNAVGAPMAVISITPDPIDVTTDQVTVNITLNYSDVGLFQKFIASSYVFQSAITLDTENKRITRL